MGGRLHPSPQMTKYKTTPRLAGYVFEGKDTTNSSPVLPEYRGGVDAKTHDTNDNQSVISSSVPPLTLSRRPHPEVVNDVMATLPFLP